MNASEATQRLNILTGALRQAMAKAPNKADEEFAELAIAAVELVGELVLDVKRLADAAEKEAAISAAVVPHAEPLGGGLFTITGCTSHETGK